MTRFLFVLALVWSLAGLTRADDHEDWLKFFEGNWGYVDEHGDETGLGVVTGKLVSNGKVLVAEFIDAGGPSIEIMGWRPDAGRLVSNGYGSAGTYYQHDFTTVTKDTLKGATLGMTADGIAYKGSIVIERKSPDQFQWRIDAKTAQGDAFEAGGTTTRKPAANQAVQEPQRAWMDYLAGTWEWVMPDGTPGTITWEMDASAPVLMGRGKSGGATWISSMSWHGGDKALIDRVYNNEGAQSEVRYSVAKDTISGIEKGWGPKGEYSSNIKLTRVSDDLLEYESTSVKLGGEAQEDLKVTVKRVKK